MSVPVPEALGATVDRIAEACRRSGREAGDVRLVAVTKAVPASRIREAVACGHRLFGENRVQEALPKIEEIGEGVRWHMIGALQRNKARQVVGVFAMVHSLDRLELARELDRRAASAGVSQTVLVQVNLSGESTKSGVSAEELDALLEAAAGMEHLRVDGLMTIPPPVDEAGQSRRWFAELREMRDRSAAKHGLALPELSMGMTDDFEVAVEEGATIVRVGRAIFGPRPRP